MTTEHAAAAQITEEELTREYELYGELLDRWPDRWFVIVGGELIHAAGPDELTRDLRSRGIGPGEVLVQRHPGPPPYFRARCLTRSESIPLLSNPRPGAFAR